MEKKRPYFQVSGALSPDNPSYIERSADVQLLEALQHGELCMVLAPRQTGKSSLMFRTMSKLNELGIHTGFADIAILGNESEIDSWFGAVVHQLGRSLELNTKSIDWWEKHNRLTPTQRFITFLEDVVMTEKEGKVVLFFDELDSVLALSFSDDFFTTIRSLFNLKAINPVLKRLDLVILGATFPSDFIRNKSRTPFNVGKEIPLSDFEPDQLTPFQDVLGPECGPVVDRIFYWTSGQPRMVQNLSEKIFKKPEHERTSETVDENVREVYLGVQVEKDVHLKTIRDYLLHRYENVRKTLGIYRSILAGKSIQFDENSRIHIRLILSGVVTVRDKDLVARNRIYREIFNLQWIKENLPRNRAENVAWITSTVLVGGLFWLGLIQPLFFPKYIEYQKYPWFEEDILYTDKANLTYKVNLPNRGIKKITINGEAIVLASGNDVKNEIQIPLILNGLALGPNSFTIRYSSGIWADRYEQKLLVVFNPIESWRPADLEMVLVDAGCFEMGCGEWDDECRNDEKPVHEVCLSAYSIGKYEVTEAQWKRVMGYNPSYSRKCGGNCPVAEVSWEQVQDFIARLNTLTDLPYRLPTEAEWEYAARSGGKKEIYSGGNEIEAVAWYDSNSNSTLHPVGQKAANGLGLYDMSGNVWEWGQDWYGRDYYGNSPAQDPMGPDTGSNRVIRGGSWIDHAGGGRAADRDWGGPGLRSVGLGFRLALPGQ